MVSKRALKIGGAGLAVVAIAIGLGVGLGMKKNTATKNLTASQASGYDMYCSRRLDGTGRLLSAPTNDVDAKKTSREDLERKLGKTSVPIVSVGGALDAVFPFLKWSRFSSMLLIMPYVPFLLIELQRFFDHPTRHGSLRPSHDPSPLSLRRCALSSVGIEGIEFWGLVSERLLPRTQSQGLSQEQRFHRDRRQGH